MRRSTFPLAATRTAGQPGTVVLPAQVLQILQQIGTAGLGADLFVDARDLARLVDVERPALGIASARSQNTEGLGDGFPGIAQNGIVYLEFFGELLVGCRVVDTGGKVGDIVTLQLISAVTQRFAFQRSAPGESLRKPGDDNRLLSRELTE